MKRPKEKTLSEFLVNERKKRGLTQQEMANKLGVSRCHYTVLENGYRKANTIGNKLLKNLSEFTGYSTEVIYNIIQKEKKEGI